MVCGGAGGYRNSPRSSLYYQRNNTLPDSKTPHHPPISPRPVHDGLAQDGASLSPVYLASWSKTNPSLPVTCVALGFGPRTKKKSKRSFYRLAVKAPLYPSCSAAQNADTRWPQRLITTPCATATQVSRNAAHPISRAVKSLLSSPKPVGQNSVPLSTLCPIESTNVSSRPPTPFALCVIPEVSKASSSSRRAMCPQTISRGQTGTPAPSHAIRQVSCCSARFLR